MYIKHVHTPPPKNGWTSVYVFKLKQITLNTSLYTCPANPGLMYGGRFHHHIKQIMKNLGTRYRRTYMVSELSLIHI